MGASFNSVLGLAFVVLALVLTFLMYHLWGYPFDKEKHQSSAPRSLTNLHRLLGYVFVAIYVILMWNMVPRLWSYQIELPARTVLHLTLGLAVGAILIVKIVVVRFFKHMESTLAPLLGTSLLICTLLLSGLALPYAAREAYLRATAQEGENFAADRIERVTTYLPQLGFDDDAGLAVLASSTGLAEGRDILNRKCTQCHDLRTILVRPRTPEAWHSTVVRMANRATIMDPINESDQWAVTAYLIAISPTLQEVAAERRELEQEASASRAAARESAATELEDYDPAQAEATFERLCSQCHGTGLVENSRLESRGNVVSLVTRMVSNGLTADDTDLSLVIAYLTDTYAAEN